MSEAPIVPLPPHIADLLEREKDGYPEDLVRKQAVYSRVEMALVLSGSVASLAGAGASVAAGRSAGSVGAGAGSGAGAGAGVAGAKGAALAKLLAVGVSAFVAGGITGGVAVRRAIRGGDSTLSTYVAPTASVAGSVKTGAPVEWTAVPPDPPTKASESTSAAPLPRPSQAIPSATARPATSAGDLTRERELVDVARAALGRGKPDDAIAAAQEHARRWPHGYLAEEREVVAIQALVAARRAGEAAERAARFHVDFPSSLFAHAVDAVVARPSGAP